MEEDKEKKPIMIKITPEMRREALARTIELEVKINELLSAGLKPCPNCKSKNIIELDKYEVFPELYFSSREVVFNCLDCNNIWIDKIIIYT